MSYTADPVVFDHDLVIGDTYYKEAELADDDGVAYDLTGMTGVGQIRLTTGGTLVLTLTVAIVSASGGTFSWSATAAATSALTPKVCRYHVTLTFADGTVHTVVEGAVNIRKALGAA